MKDLASWRRTKYDVTSFSWLSSAWVLPPKLAERITYLVERMVMRARAATGGGSATRPTRRVPVSFSEPLLLLSLASICASVDNAVFFGCFYWAEHVVIAPRRLFSAAGCRCFSTAIWLCPLSGVANMLNGSTLIKGRWKIVKKIGAGAFGANEPHSGAPA